MTSRRREPPTRSMTRSRSWQRPCRPSWQYWPTQLSSDRGGGTTRSSNRACQASSRQHKACGGSLSCWIPGRHTASSAPAWPQHWACSRQASLARCQCQRPPPGVSRGWEPQCRFTLAWGTCFASRCRSPRWTWTWATT